MITATERFDAAFRYVRTFNKTIDVGPVLGFDQNMQYLLGAEAGLLIDTIKPLTAQALGLWAVKRTSDPNSGTTSSFIDRVELYRDTEGNVVPSFSDRADIFVENSEGLNHGHPNQMHEVPEKSRELALNSALALIEQAVDAHRESLITVA